jgi:heme A synthase
MGGIKRTLFKKFTSQFVGLGQQIRLHGFSFFYQWPQAYPSPHKMQQYKEHNISMLLDNHKSHTSIEAIK